MLVMGMLQPVLFYSATRASLYQQRNGLPPTFRRCLLSHSIRVVDFVTRGVRILSVVSRSHLVWSLCSR